MNAHSVCVGVGVGVYQPFLVVFDIDFFGIAGPAVHVPCTTFAAGVKSSRAFGARTGGGDVSQASTPSNVLYHEYE